VSSLNAGRDSASRQDATHPPAAIATAASPSVMRNATNTEAATVAAQPRRRALNLKVLVEAFTKL
jgi:hypothetical protein